MILWVSSGPEWSIAGAESIVTDPAEYFILPMQAGCDGDGGGGDGKGGACGSGDAGGDGGGGGVITKARERAMFVLLRQEREGGGLPLLVGRAKQPLHALHCVLVQEACHRRERASDPEIKFSGVKACSFYPGLGV